MGETWLESSDEELDVKALERRIEERMAQRATVEADDGNWDFGLEAVLPEAEAPAEKSACDTILHWLQDCDIVPAHYVIDWHVPILGPIHAAVRRVIHAEMRRFLLPALEKQSHLNRVVLHALAELCQENACLSRDLEQARRELAQLRQEQELDG